MTRAYAGIGSRETPAQVCRVFTSTAHALAEAGWVLRTGGATGADTAFEMGHRATGRPFELYLPWAGFNGRTDVSLGSTQPQKSAYALAASLHPAWDRCSRGARTLHARNVHQILGPNVSAPQPVACVLCWTPNGAGSGGTGGALRIAQQHGVPIFDAGSCRWSSVDEGAEDIRRWLWRLQAN